MPKSHIAEVVDLGTPITKFRKQPTICRDRKFEVTASAFRQRCEHALDAAIEAATGDMERGHGSGARVPRVPGVPGVPRVLSVLTTVRRSAAER